MSDNTLSLSYIVLRRIIGILGILLPFFCILGAFLFAGLPAQHSISFYYHTNMQDFFVGLMFCTGIFLLSYSGYETADRIITVISGVTAISVAFFPCLEDSDKLIQTGIFRIPAGISDKIHFISAAVLFLALAINSLFLFTKSNKEKGQLGRNKRRRNIIYIVCGFVMIGALLTLLICSIAMENIKQTSIVLILETVLLLAFGISWLVKGETLFADKEQPESR
jgi:hypothetical protein